MAFEAFSETLDPDGQQEFVFTFTVVGDEESQTVVTSFVDSTGTTEVIVDVPEIISTDAADAVESVISVTVWVNGDGVDPGTYYLHCRLTTDSTPARIMDKTKRVIVRQS